MRSRSLPCADPRRLISNSDIFLDVFTVQDAIAAAEGELAGQSKVIRASQCIAEQVIGECSALPPFRHTDRPSSQQGGGRFAECVETAPRRLPMCRPMTAARAAP